MTVQQEAYQLIDSLPEDSVRAVINIMTRMAPKNSGEVDSVSRKKMAFIRLRELQKLSAPYGKMDAEEERQAAVSEKYGQFMELRGQE